MPREITISLPDDLAEQAEPLGLLNSKAYESWLRDAVRRSHVREFLDAADRLAAQDEPPMSEDEIQAEIDAYRAERRAATAHRR